MANSSPGRLISKTKGACGGLEGRLVPATSKIAEGEGVPRDPHRPGRANT